MTRTDDTCALCDAPSTDAIPDACADYTICAVCGLARRSGAEARGALVRHDEASAWRRATTALRLGRLEASDSVLVVDGGPGLCRALEDVIGVRATDYPPTGAPLASFDCVLLYDRLERVADPVGLLERALRWLKPGGRVVLEVANLGCPEGVLVDGLLDGSRAHVFDEVTLAGALARAGVEITRMDADARILATGVYRPGPVQVHPGGRRGVRVAAELDGHRHLERLRRAILTSRTPSAHLSGLDAILARPTPAARVNRVVRELERLLAGVHAYHLCLALCDAATRGDVPPALRDHCRQSASLYRAKLGHPEPTYFITPAA